MRDTADWTYRRAQLSYEEWNAIEEAFEKSPRLRPIVALLRRSDGFLDFNAIRAYGLSPMKAQTNVNLKLKTKHFPYRLLCAGENEERFILFLRTPATRL